MRKINKINIYISIVLIALIIILCFYIFAPKVFADETSELIINDISDNNATIKQYTNIGSYMNNLKRYRTINPEDKVLEELNISKADLGNDLSILNTADSITVSDTIMRVADDGQVEFIPIHKVTEKDYDDIVNNKGNHGYMSGKIVAVQDSKYNNVSKNKDGEITAFHAYGIQCTFTMKWFDAPTYRMKDLFTFKSVNGESYTMSGYSTGYMEYRKFKSSSSQLIKEDCENYYQNGWPCYIMNLPNNDIGVTYKEISLTATGRIFANGNCQVSMGYAHKQLVVGDITLNNDSGLSFSCGTDYRSYIPSGMPIYIIKDPALEALRN